MRANDSKSIRIFKSDFLEALTHVHPIIPLVLWAPVVSFLIYRAVILNQLPLDLFLLIFALAIFVWTFTEYFLHRFVFHFQSENKIIKRIVFMFHGLHHDDPEDPTRLVMPPVPAILIMSILWKFFGLLISAKLIDSFMSGFIFSYLCYDYIHYGTHHFKMNSKIGRFLKKFHLQHHYSKEDINYGVSNPLWDYVFKTRR